MAILFIADVHLQLEKPKVCTGFLDFLRGKMVDIDALYILGDLFEIWIGDEDPNPLHRIMGAAIKGVVDSGIPCFLIHGNHDFLIGERFARESGIILLPEEKVLDLYGYKILIMHGDTLCTNDIGYQSFRAKIRKPWIKTLFLSLPLFIRSRIVSRIRASERDFKNKKHVDIMDVNPFVVADVMKKYCVHLLIHGHTHRPNIHKITANGKSAFRMVLSSWNNIGSMVRITPQSAELVYFPL